MANISARMFCLLYTITAPDACRCPPRTSTLNNLAVPNIAKSQGQEGLNALNTAYPRISKSAATLNSFIVPTVLVGSSTIRGFSCRYRLAVSSRKHSRQQVFAFHLRRSLLKVFPQLRQVMVSIVPKYHAIEDLSRLAEG